ncbi:MAG: hypothetical protein JWM28_1233, partial [Chitinophagaceae bacterium]|nr:hypothetical protein [Chitinophagaceae bacterium]
MTNNLRKAVEGYDKLKAEGGVHRISDLKQELTDTPLSFISGKASKLVFGAGITKAELITRQYLLLQFAGLELNRQLLSSYAESGKESTFVLPKEWRKIIGRYGINMAHRKSSYAWNKYLLTRLFRCFKLVCKEVMYALLQIFSIKPISQPGENGSYAFFGFLDQNNIPRMGNDERSYDIISWYILWEGKAKTVDTVCHGVKDVPVSTYKGVAIKYINDPIIPLYTKAQLVSYIVWCLRILFVSFFSFIRGRWWNILMLEEAILASKTRLQDTALLGKEYFFHNSNWIYKPLWTYEAENKGSKIYFYFYSTNCEGFRKTNDKPSYHYGFDAMNWPNYLVWDSHQADFVRKLAGSSGANIRVVGPIWFSSTYSEMLSIPEKAIAVFDVQPMKESFYKTLANSFDFYTPENCTRFLTDIYAACEKSGYSMVLKRKREAGKYTHREYRKMVSELSTLPRYLAV